MRNALRNIGLERSQRGKWGNGVRECSTLAGLQLFGSGDIFEITAEGGEASSTPAKGCISIFIGEIIFI